LAIPSSFTILTDRHIGYRLLNESDVVLTGVDNIASNVTYSLEGDDPDNPLFFLNETSGAITLSRPFNAELGDPYAISTILKVTTTDDMGNTVTAFAPLDIQFTIRNDHAPVMATPMLWIDDSLLGGVTLTEEHLNFTDADLPDPATITYVMTGRALG